MQLNSPRPWGVRHAGWIKISVSMIVALSMWVCLLAGYPSPLLAQTSWLQNKANGNIAYFLFAAPARIERYDLSSASWLTTISLPATPTAFAVDSDGLYVAFDRRVSRFTLEGSEETHLENTTTAITDLFTINTFLYINHSAYPNGKLTSVNKLTGLTIDSKEYLYKVLNGLSVGPMIGKVFARDSGISPAEIIQVKLNTDGTLGTAGDSPYHGAYPTATKTFIFPNETRVVDSAGIVYNTSDLTYGNSLAGAVDDIAFAGDLPIVLRAGTLIAHNNALLETGTYTPAQRPQKIYVHGDNIVAFANGSARGVQAAAIALSLLEPASPGAAVDPVGLTYTPDVVLLGNDDVLYLFSKAHRSIFRWSLAARAYLPTIALIQAPSHVAYSPATNRLYLAYTSGKLTQIRPADALTEQPFANSPQTPCGLATAGEYVFVCDPSGAWESHFTYHPDGTLLAQKDWNYFSKAYVWNAANRKIYFFRDDTSPNDLLWEEIDNEGLIGAKQETPYHSSDGIVHPIRVAPDGSVVVLGSGRIYDAISLSQTDSLSNNISDATWRNGRLYTAHQIASQTQIQQWGATYGLEKAIELESSGTQLFAMDGGLLAVTNYAGLPRFVLLTDELTVRYQSPTLVGLQATNDGPAPVGKSVLFESQLKGSVGTVTYAWAFGDGVQGSGKIASHSYVNAGVYLATVSAKNALETVTATTTVTITGATGADVPITGLTITTDSPTQFGNPTSLTAAVQAGTNVNYQWTLGDGSVASGAQISHTYAATGSYTATVTATNGAGSVTASAVVLITAGEVECTPLTAVTIQPDAINLPYTGNVQRFTAIIDPPAAVDESILYELFINEQSIDLFMAPDTPLFDYTFAEAGSYKVSIDVDNACSEGHVSASTNMTILPRPDDQPDLSQSVKSVTLANVEAGDILTYTIHLRNRQAIAAQVRLTETLPAYTTYLPDRAQVSEGALSVMDQTLNWTGEVISGTPVLLTYAVRVEIAPIDTLLTSVGWVADQFGNAVKVKATSTYNPGYRLSINAGALYTNQPHVALTYSWDAAHDIQFVKFSNDGGFGPGAGTTEWLPVNAQTPTYANWPLTAQHNTLLPRTVYALFRRADGSQYGPFQDDIILDNLPPKLLQVAFVTEATGHDKNAAAEAQVRVTASDDNSGIAFIAFSAQPDFATATTYAMRGSSMEIAIQTPAVDPLYVRALDRAGNHSPTYLLLTGSSVRIFLPVITR